MKQKSTATPPATTISTTPGVSHSPASVGVGFFDAFDGFAQDAKHLINGGAGEKGYAKDGDGRALMDFIADRGLTHAEGEMIYKVLRWHHKHNPEDLHKVAAWAFLELDRHQRKSGKEWGNHG